MFGSIGGPEILFVLVLALLLLGPRKLPQIGRTLGRTLGELNRATQDFKTTLEREIDLESVRQARGELDTAARETARAVGDVASPASINAAPLRKP